ncbi:hypothetical protein ONO86_03813 [Micromonospora noduli]|nr:hypothetical protein ONO86_03813 [Micromonospora noduli]
MGRHRPHGGQQQGQPGEAVPALLQHHPRVRGRGGAARDRCHSDPLLRPAGPGRPDPLSGRHPQPGRVHCLVAPVVRRQRHGARQPVVRRTGQPSRVRPGTGRPGHPRRVARRRTRRHALRDPLRQPRPGRLHGGRPGRRPAVRRTHQGRPDRPVLGRVRRAGPAHRQRGHRHARRGSAVVERREGRAVGVPGRARRGAPDLGRTRPDLPHHVRRPAPARRPVRQRVRRRGALRAVRGLRRPPSGRGDAGPARRAVPGVRPGGPGAGARGGLQGQPAPRRTETRHRPRRRPGLVTGGRRARPRRAACRRGATAGERGLRHRRRVRRGEPPDSGHPARRHRATTDLPRGRHAGPAHRAAARPGRGGGVPVRAGLRRAGSAAVRPARQRAGHRVLLRPDDVPVGTSAHRRGARPALHVRPGGQPDPGGRTGRAHLLRQRGGAGRQRLRVRPALPVGPGERAGVGRGAERRDP